MQFGRRFPLLGIVCALGIMCSLPAWPQDASGKHEESAGTQRLSTGSEKTPLATTSLGDNIYLLSGDGANILAVSDNNSVVLINSGTSDRATELAHAVYEAAPRPVTTVVDTDWHSDDAGGNPYFSSLRVTIIAHANTKRRIAEEYRAALKRYVANNQSSFKVVVSPWSAAVEDEASRRYALRGIPTVAFDNSMTIDLDTEELQFCHFGAAHTDGDTVIFVQKANIAVIGDIFPGNGYPLIDLDSGGSVTGIIDTMDRVLSLTNEETRIVPAHGPVVHKAELQTYRDMLATIQKKIKTLMETGATADQILAAAPTADFDTEWGGGYVDGEMFTLSAVESIARGK